MDLFEMIGLSGKTIETLTEDEKSQLQAKVLEVNRSLTENKSPNISVSEILKYSEYLDIEKVLAEGSYEISDLKNASFNFFNQSFFNIDFIEKFAEYIPLEEIDWTKIDFTNIENNEKLISFFLNYMNEINVKNLSQSNIIPEYVTVLNRSNKDFRNQFDFTEYAITHAVDINFLIEHKKLIDWYEFSKRGNITTELFNTKTIGEGDTATISLNGLKDEFKNLFNLEAIEQNPNISAHLKDQIKQELNAKIQGYVEEATLIKEAVGEEYGAFLTEVAQIGIEPQIFASVPNDLREQLFVIARSGLDVSDIIKKIEKDKDITNEQVEAYFYGIKNNVDMENLNFNHAYSIPRMYEEINARINGDKNYKGLSNGLGTIQQKILNKFITYPEFEKPSVNLTAAQMNEFFLAQYHNAKENGNIDLNTLLNLDNTDLMRFYRLSSENGYNITPEEVASMLPRKAKVLNQAMEEGYNITDYISNDVHYKKFLDDNEEFVAFKLTEDFLKRIQKSAESAYTMLKTLFTKEKPIQKEQIVNEELKEVKKDEQSEKPEPVEEIVEDEVKPETPIVEVPQETKKEENKREDAVPIEVEEVEKVESPVNTGRGKIITEEDMEFTQIEIDAAVYELNQEIAGLIRSTILTQEEFDTLSWSALGERFGQDVKNLNKALEIIRTAKENGLTGLDYVDVNAIVDLRNAKIEQQKFAMDFYSINEEIKKAQENIPGVNRMLHEKREQDLAAPENAKQQEINNLYNEIYKFLPKEVKHVKNNLGINDDKTYFTLSEDGKKVNFNISCPGTNGEFVNLSYIYNLETKKIILPDNINEVDKQITGRIFGFLSKSGDKFQEYANLVNSQDLTKYKEQIIDEKIKKAQIDIKELFREFANPEDIKLIHPEKNNLIITVSDVCEVEYFLNNSGEVKHLVKFAPEDIDLEFVNEIIEDFIPEYFALMNEKVNNKEEQIQESEQPEIEVEVEQEPDVEETFDELETPLSEDTPVENNLNYSKQEAMDDYIYTVEDILRNEIFAQDDTTKYVHNTTVGFLDALKINAEEIFNIENAELTVKNGIVSIFDENSKSELLFRLDNGTFVTDNRTNNTEEINRMENYLNIHKIEANFLSSLSRQAEIINLMQEQSSRFVAKNAIPVLKINVSANTNTQSKNNDAYIIETMSLEIKGKIDKNHPEKDCIIQIPVEGYVQDSSGIFNNENKLSIRKEFTKLSGKISLGYQYEIDKINDKAVENDKKIQNEEFAKIHLANETKQSIPDEQKPSQIDSDVLKKLESLRNDAKLKIFEITEERLDNPSAKKDKNLAKAIIRDFDKLNKNKTPTKKKVFDSKDGLTMGTHLYLPMNDGTVLDFNVSAKSTDSFDCIPVINVTQCEFVDGILTPGALLYSEDEVELSPNEQEREAMFTDTSKLINTYNKGMHAQEKQNSQRTEMLKNNEEIR